MKNSSAAQVLQYLDAAGTIILSLKPDETVELINQKACELLGQTKEEVVGKNWFHHFIPEESRKTLNEICREVLRDPQQSGKKVESYIATGSGKKRLVSWTIKCVKDIKGTGNAVLLSGEDITEKRSNEAFTNTLNEQLSEIVMINDEAGIFQYVSPSFYKILGHEPGKVRGENLLDYIHPAERSGIIQLYKQLRRIPSSIVSYKYRILAAAGNYIWIEGESRNLLEDANIRGIVSHFRNISERVSLEERFRILFELSPDGLLLMDDKGIIDCNHACLKMLGCKNKDEVIGRPPFLFSPKYQPDGKLSASKAKEIKENGLQGNRSFDWLHKNFAGGVFPVEVSIIPLEKLGKDISLVRWHNITQRKRFELELLMAKSEAEATSKAQEEFLSTMSHEIRTPLNAVVGLSHILLDENPREDQVETLKTLKFSSENLLSLINDILDYNKIQSGKIKLEQIEFNLTHLANSVSRALQYKAEEKNLQLKVSTGHSVPDVVIGDPTRLAQVLNNLMSNAVKFTNKGSVELRIFLARELEKEIDIRFEVKDSGIGISEAKLTTIFEQFTQADSATTRKYGGTGLGLSITKKLLLLMGAEIMVESREGKGSSFYYTIRFQKKTGGFAAVEKLSDNESLQHLNLSILLVEDNEINQLVVSRFIRKWGIEVDIAGHGEIAIKKSRSKTYDLILMDLQMPDIDGFTTSKRIREEGYAGPIIALTAEVLFDVKDKVMKAGMNDIVGKPFKPQVLFQKIKNYCLKEVIT